MAREFTTTIGSGTLAQNRDHPIYQNTGFSNQFPGLGSKDQLRTRTGEGSVILNPEDFSLNKDFGHFQMTIGITATPISSLTYQRTIALHNKGPDELFWGSVGVTTLNGFPLAVGEKISIDIQGNDQVRIYVISAGTSDLRGVRFA